MEGYAVGQRPPELAEDGTFKTLFDVRASSIIDEYGRVLSVDKTTGLLAEDDSDD